MSLKLFKKTAILLIIFSIFTLGCTKKKEAGPSSMEEIYKVQGVPVKVETVQLQEFVKSLDYNATVNGIKETPVFAKVSDKVMNINAKIGQKVQKDQVIIDFPENNIQASYHQAKASFQLASQTWERMQSLYETGGISKQDLDSAETQFKVAQANWDTVQQMIHVRAPFEGIITDINARKMQAVATGDFLFTVSQLEHLYSRIWVSETDINSVKKGADIKFIWNGHTKIGEITELALSINKDFNAFAADVILDNADLSIKSGVTGTVLVEIYRNNEAVVVPRNLVKKDETGKTFVYVAENSKAKRRDVQIGNESELDYEIISGLTPGDILIVSGLQFVNDNVKLSIQ
ncbi:MAG: efflux RND transporter periplasmic adaptor subunit [Candidatus Cloacimonetes bacterium]|nr:efflux RND transporter periplasmic adaptor subunit [Candidatus Cloacimonadota bacterium]